MKAFLFGANRFDRASIPSEISDTTAWPAVDASALDQERRANFLARAEAIRLFVEEEDVTVREIKKRTGIPAGTLYRVFQRCLLPHADGRIQGFRALIPYEHVRGYTRTAELSVNGGNASGAFSQLLARYASLERWLQRKIEDRGKRSQGFKEVRRSIVRIHKLFLEECCFPDVLLHAGTCSGWTMRGRICRRARSLA